MVASSWSGPVGFLAAAVVGGVWLGVIAVLAYLQIDLDAPSSGRSRGRACCSSEDSRWGWCSEC